MKLFKALLLVFSHLVVLAVGFGAGVYILPILIAPPAPSVAEIKAISGVAEYRAEFRRDLKGSDPIHWGKGMVWVGHKAIAFEGRIAPGPDYKLYLSPEFVETKEEFLKLKARSLRLGDVNTFDSFVVPVPSTADISRYNTVVVWCEAFSFFITAAKYR